MSFIRGVETLVQEVRYAVGGFRRAPLFTLVAVVVIALGVALNTAVFSVVDRILFRGLPYPQDDRLVSFGMTAPIAAQEFTMAYDYLDWHEARTPFETLGAWSGESDCDYTAENPVRLRCAQVDSHLLPTLGIQMLLGRNMTAGEDQPHAPPVAIISYGLWRSRFGGDPRVTGKLLPLDGQMATIIGVLPPQFELPTLARADVLVPLALDRAEQRTRRKAILLSTVGRLKPGITPEQAAAALRPLFQRALELGVTPEFWKEVKLRVRPLRDRQIQDARLASWILFGAVLAVQAICCANVASLLLARAEARQREYAVRAALGAGRGRLACQALIESMILGLAGGGAGCALAGLLVRLFVTVAPQGIPRLNQATLDVRVLVFTLAASMGSGVLLGLATAMRNPRTEMLGTWRTAGRNPLLRQTLVAAQISLSLILLSGAGLLLRTLRNLENQPLGMRGEGVVTASVSLSQNTYSNPARRLAFFEELEARLRSIPGVREAALANWVPPEGKREAQMLYALLNVAGRPGVEKGTGGMVMWRSVTPRYFAALRVPIVRGRGFEETDRDPGRNAMILSESLARRLFPGEDPLGKQVLPGRGEWRTVVGVAANVKNNGLVEPDAPEFYEVRKHSPQEMWRSGTAIVRSSMDRRQIAEWVRAQVAAIDAGLPVEVAVLDDQVSKLAARPRFNALLLAMFAGLGLALAGTGLYGLISFTVAQRTQEIGVRMALGATPGGIIRLILRHAAGCTAIGAAVGTAGALLATRLLEAMLFGVSSKDPWTLAVAVSVLFATALAAAWIPARHAARVDPVEALRSE